MTRALTHSPLDLFEMGMRNAGLAEERSGGVLTKELGATKVTWLRNAMAPMDIVIPGGTKPEIADKLRAGAVDGVFEDITGSKPAAFKAEIEATQAKARTMKDKNAIRALFDKLTDRLKSRRMPDNGYFARNMKRSFNVKASPTAVVTDQAKQTAFQEAFKLLWTTAITTIVGFIATRLLSQALGVNATAITNVQSDGSMGSVVANQLPPQPPPLDVATAVVTDNTQRSGAGGQMVVEVERPASSSSPQPRVLDGIDRILFKMFPTIVDRMRATIPSTLAYGVNRDDYIEIELLRELESILSSQFTVRQQQAITYLVSKLLFNSSLGELATTAGDVARNYFLTTTRV